MSTELSILNPKSLPQAKQTLKGWVPASKEQAGLFLLFVSLATGTAGKDAKAAAVEYINKCVDCDKHEFEGFTLKKVEKKNVIYNGSARSEKLSEQLAKAQAEVEQLKIKLNAELELSGIKSEKKEFSHWLIQ